MADNWLILHGGALGDLILTIQLILRLPGVSETGVLHIISRTNPGDLSMCQPRILRQSSEGLGLHWLFGDHDDPSPEHLRERVRGARVLSALGGTHTIQHHRLQSLEPAALYSLDPQPRAGVNRHITEQWQTQLEAQGLLVPKCIHQRPTQRCLGVPDELRQRGRRLLADQNPERERRARAARPAGEEALAGASGSDEQPEACLVIHPGSGGRSKCWPLRCFLTSARQMQEHVDARVCFLLGPVEVETWSPAELEAITAEFPVLQSPPPDDLVALLAAARLFIGNDAGPAHLAAVLGTPAITVFGPTSADVWRPLGPRVQAISGDAGAGADWKIDPEQVVARVARVRSVSRS